MKPPGLRVTVPKSTVSRLVGFAPPGWVRMTTADRPPFFAWARRPPSRPSVDVGLPRRLFEPELAGTEIEMVIEDATPYRAPPVPKSTGSTGFDWLPYVDAENYFPTETLDGKLLLHNRYEEPFAIRRVTATEPTYRMLGLYQAEGSKGSTALDVNLSSTNPLLPRHAAELFTALGIGREHLSLEILRGHRDTADEARTAFAIEGVDIVAERATSTPSQKKASAGVLHVRKSKPFLRLIRGALSAVFASEFPSEAAAREYALGWLDGDGTITITTSNPELRLAGLYDEHEVMKRALVSAFGWKLEPGSRYIDDKQGTHISLRAIELLDLLDANAFSFSMSRVRLLLAFDRRTHGLREIAEGKRSAAGGYARWGLVDEDGVTELGEKIRAGHKRWQVEIEKARQLEATAPHLFGVKGVPNPL